MRTGPSQRWRRRLAQSPVAIDALLAAFVTALGLVSLASTTQAGQHAPDLVGVLLVLLSGVPVAARSTAPVTVLAITLAASLAVVALGYAQVNGGLGALFSLYSVAALRPRRISVPVGIATVLVIGLALVLAIHGAAAVDVAVNVLASALFWGAGAWSSSRRGYVRGLEERNAALVQARESQARAALVEARGAVAREIQDVVGHSVMAMTVQATAARRLVGRDPQAADASLAEVEGLGRAAIQEVRRVLGLLGDESADTRPQPGVDQLDELVDGARRDGLDVVLERSGTEPPIPTGAGLTVYRVVEEALRNAAQHAGPARVLVSLCRTEDLVEVSVSDDGRGAPSWCAHEDGGPTGILSLTERVESYGGTLTAGPRRGGGFTVTAVIPATAESRSQM